VSRKKYDPLWEIVGEKIALQGSEPDFDARCPYCHVVVHLGRAAKAGDRYECGLCGGLSEATEEQGSLTLVRAGQ
jgi:hypothetical protein